MIYHACMQETKREQLRRQEAAISKLHQRSRECFRHLKAAAAHPPQQICKPLQDKNLHSQPTAAITADRRAGEQPVRTTEEVQREQIQMDVPAWESQPSQPRSASPVKSMCMCLFHLTDVRYHTLIPVATHIVTPYGSRTDFVKIRAPP